jgi:hypothetical protein
MLLKKIHQARGKQKNLKKQNFLFFIDDLNLCYTNKKRKKFEKICDQNGFNFSEFSNNHSFKMELARQIMESQTLYSNDIMLSTSGYNFIFACSTNSFALSNFDGIMPLSESLTKHTLTVNLRADVSSMIEHIFAIPVTRWLNEFPLKFAPNFVEISKPILDSIGTIYASLIENLKPTPCRPSYLFSFRDIERVFQGMFLFSSKSKKFASNSENLTLIVIKLFIHEVLRVFGDRISVFEGLILGACYFIMLLLKF